MQYPVASAQLRFATLTSQEMITMQRVAEDLESVSRQIGICSFALDDLRQSAANRYDQNDLEACEDLMNVTRRTRLAIRNATERIEALVIASSIITPSPAPKDFQ